MNNLMVSRQVSCLVADMVSLSADSLLSLQINRFFVSHMMSVPIGEFASCIGNPFVNQLVSQLVFI